MTEAQGGETLDTDVRPFAAWMSDQLGATVAIIASQRTQQGFSNETWLLDVAYEDQQRSVVLRLEPGSKRLFPDTNVADQVLVLEALAANGEIPVPIVLWHEPSAAVLGRPFYVMDRVAGRIPSDTYLFEGWVHDLGPLAQAQVQSSMIEAMASIHRLDWRAAGLGTLSSAGLDHQFDYWGSYIEWAGIESPALRAAYDWCVQHRPHHEPPPSLVWGDARLGNLIFAEDLSVRAVLDWEMASIGPAELDVGWHLMLERVAQGFGGELEGFADRSGAVAVYEHVLGRPVSNLDWYEIWGGVRAAAVNIRLGRLRSGREPASDPVLDAIFPLLN